MPYTIALGGMLAGWVGLLAAMVVGFKPKREVRSRSRDFGAPLSIALQGAGFAFAFSGRLGRPSPFFTGTMPTQWLATAVVVGLSVSSAAFVFAAVRTLGKQWSLQPELVVDHKLITAGPYAIVRHPIYTSLFGLMLASGIVFTSPLILSVATVLFLIGTVIRMRVEERLLRTSFGEVYTTYSRRVPALIPFLRRR